MNKNNVTTEFINAITTKLIDVNESLCLDGDELLDVPFMVSALVQNLSNDVFTSFVSDVNNHKFSLEYEGIDICYLADYAKIQISLDRLDYMYSIIFTKDSRPYNNCDCKPEDDGYIIEKRCCGNKNCDWYAPAFRLIKISTIGGESSWSGKASDYWDFETEFYKSQRELLINKVKREKEDKIKDLKSKIRNLQDELDTYEQN